MEDARNCYTTTTVTLPDVTPLWEGVLIFPQKLGVLLPAPGAGQKFRTGTRHLSPISVGQARGNTFVSRHFTCHTLLDVAKPSEIQNDKKRKRAWVE